MIAKGSVFHDCWHLSRAGRRGLCSGGKRTGQKQESHNEGANGGKFQRLCHGCVLTLPQRAQTPLKPAAYVCAEGGGNFGGRSGHEKRRGAEELRPRLARFGV
jgi:hypothetical protein